VKKERFIFELSKRLQGKTPEDDPWRREDWLENLDSAHDEDEREITYEDILREIGE
jgi:hypothetical protein